MENNKMAKIRKVNINPGEVIQVIHKKTGTVLSIVIDLDDEYVHISHVSNADGLGLSWDGASKRKIDAMINQYYEAEY
jgi:hypothetical protein